MTDFYTSNNGGGFGASQNNNERNRVNTTGVVLFDQESCMLKCAFLDDSLALTIGEPLKGPDGKNTFPDSQRYSALITVDRAAALYDIIIHGVLPALEKGEDYCAGVFVNRNKTKIVQIRVQDKEVYLVLCMNINENRITESSHVFHFQKNDIITGYNPSTGDSDSQSTVHGAFFVFTKWIECGVGGISGGAGHSAKKVLQFQNDRFYQMLRQIATKVGVVLDNGGMSYQPNPGFMQIPETPSGELPFSEENASTIDAILG